MSEVFTVVGVGRALVRRLAALADFLLSRDASWIARQVIAVDGGRSTVRTRG